MSGGKRVGTWAIAALFVALALSLAGEILRRSGVSEFWGGLIAAFGEAALVGGLADWFAVRALFGHPLGLRIFPHTAIIPRNRQRIVREVRNLVQNEWLPKDMLVARVHAFDFVGDGLLPLMETFRPKLRGVLRTAARQALKEVSPPELAAFLSHTADRSIDAGKLAPYAADLVHRVREEAWLGPVLHDWVGRFRAWAASPESRTMIQTHLRQAALGYRRKSLWKDLTMSVAEMTGGVDLEGAANLLQDQITRFAEEQLLEESQLNALVRDGLADLERRLRDDPEFLAWAQDAVHRAAGSGTLNGVIEPVLAALKAEALKELDREDSPVLTWAADQVQVWIDRVAQDPDARDRLNAWCRRIVSGLIDRHHSLLGAMVEDRLNRFSDENLVEMIEAKVGEDLNWIRINGSLVGGLVGMFLYLGVSLLDLLIR